MKLVVNGQERTFAENSLTVAQLLEYLGVENRYVAVQVNDEVVRRGTFAEVRLKDGDIVQIVQFMGGGAGHD